MAQVDVGMESWADQVPMMFRAQTDGRCQIQRLDPRRQKEQVKQDCGCGRMSGWRKRRR